MSEAPFKEPRLSLNRIYTGRGDTGETSLVGGQRASKDALRIECYGTVDELNSFTGVACVTAETYTALAPLVAILKRVQHELFNLGSVLATLPEDVKPMQPQITPIEVTQLEREIDSMNADCPRCIHSCCLAAPRSMPPCMSAGRFVVARNGFVSPWPGRIRPRNMRSSI